ncbi:hypothetical protein EDC14_1013115 [Hydrogenispora ethanolica]|uniref:Uncharacterized protein n=1 Tax=Hydrogenispora ethanolica TaxID=1082276 RepID=A0A4R1RQ97_HYDET|nr:hypothetical protein [Hydrogenispora ethanolica]TCL68573.1 hypothetical protein EDC14_1013115 [Hydrogenispora ethanolica]
MDAEWLKRYAPYLYFDKKEPFYPLRVGWTVLDSPGRSPSFPRDLYFDGRKIKFVIEYAIYWHFDIGHLYELEHVWVYLDHAGRVADCEASFHGRYLKGLLKDRSNLADDTHVELYSQPGKHAFSPLPQLFELLPGFAAATLDDAGRDGLCVTGVARGRYETDPETDRLVRRYLQQYRFQPSLEFQKYVIAEQLLVPWPELDQAIPGWIAAQLAEIRRSIGEPPGKAGCGA